jgi:sensor c-di-GMP phosphodiesterase-like protein
MINLDTIRAGLTQGEFFLEYLPTVSLTDGRCIGAEALIRWRRATGVVPPGDFIPLAENTPLSGLITYWVIDTVAAEMGDWLRANPEAHISINVPPEILGRGGIEYSANKSGLLELASQLILEITERGVLDLIGVKAINNSWGSGVRIALDDVTHTGGANLAVLARCNLHIVKIDRSLVSQIGPQCPSPEWLKGISALIQASRLEVVAEGIETEQQMIVLRTANIQAAQGFYFSRPIPAAAFIAYHHASIHGRTTRST